MTRSPTGFGRPRRSASASRPRFLWEAPLPRRRIVPAGPPRTPPLRPPAVERPPGALADERSDGRDQQAADDERVDQNAQSHGQADLEEQLEWRGHKRPKRAGQDQTGRSDDRAGARRRYSYTRPQLARRALFADPRHQEDVVVGSESDEQDEDHERDELVHAGLAKEVLQDQGPAAEAHRVRQQDGENQVDRRDKGPEQQDQDDQDADDGDRGNAQEVGRDGVLDVRELGRGTADV